MRTILIAVAALWSTAVGAQVQPSSIAGDWAGVLKAGGAELHLVLHVTNTPDGTLKATLDSTDQGALGIPVSSISLTGAKLAFKIAAVGGSYEGAINDAGSVIDGTWTQGGSLPLVLTRAGATVSTPVRRPQNPIKPFPYRDEDVSYRNAGAGITLAATLTMPSGTGPFPAVVLITGSGPQDRDESLMGHRPFLVLSDYLTRHGIAVLRADDRGVAKSTGTFATATSADFATDAEAGVTYLQSRTEIDAKKIGLVGHSEGGLIAPMIAARNPAVAFIVLMAGSGVSGDEILLEQGRLIAAANGATPEQLAQNATRMRAALQLVKTEQDETVLAAKLREQLTGLVPAEAIDAQVKPLLSPWYRYFVRYDPAPALTRVKVPVLAINGEKDLQVPPKQNLPAIRKALESGGNTRIEVVELTGLNHLFQTAKTGAPSEYAQIEETMAPLALDTITRWILKQ
jgi:pimeloyl-ACP methyl ester carboxylesterase